MKKIFLMIMLIVLISLFSMNVLAAGDEISVYLDCVKIEFDVKPQTINGRTMVPIRAIFEKMGATVNWDSKTNTAVCVKEDVTVEMTVGSMDMFINKTLEPMDIAPVVIDGRTLAPARYVAEAFDATVNWDETNNAVLIFSKGVKPEKFITLYANDGRTTKVFESKVEAYLNVGWYKTLGETQQILYAADGRKITVFKSEVSAYKKVGWYETYAEAQAANKTANKGQFSDKYYYRTPTGKKYHIDPGCGGKNSYRTNDITGLTACSKCAQ